MRFGLDVTALGRPWPSGIRTLLRELLPHLAREAGGDRLLLWQNDVRARSRPLQAPQGESIETVSTRVPPRLLEWLWRRSAWPPIEGFTGPLDVFHSPQGRLPPSRRARLVLSLNDFRHSRLPHLYPGARWHPREIARADHFIALSETTLRDAVRYLSIPEDRITRIYLGPPEVPAGLDPETLARARCRLGIAAPYVLCPSSSDPRKNPLAAARGFARVKERLGCPHRLVVVGEVPPGDEAALRREGAGLVVLTGPVSDLDYHALLAGASAAVHPSLAEGFGLPVLEAFSWGVPQAVAGDSALPEVAGDAALTFDPSSTDELASALGRLIAEPALARELVSRGRRRLADFSWERTARETLDLYRRLAAGPGPRPKGLWSRYPRRPVFERAPASVR